MAAPVERRPFAYAVLVSVIVAATVSGGAIMFEAAGFVTHGVVKNVWLDLVLPVAVDSAGLIVTIVFGVQLMSGYRLFQPRSSPFRKVHSAIAWGVAGLVVLHGAGGLYHSLLPPVESAPILLDWFGGVLVLVVALQLLSGYRVFKLKPRTSRVVHLTLAMVLAAGVIGHTVIGLVHTVTG